MTKLIMGRHVRKIVYFGRKKEVIEKIGYRKTSVGLRYLFLRDKINADSNWQASSIMEREYDKNKTRNNR